MHDITRLNRRPFAESHDKQNPQLTEIRQPQLHSYQQSDRLSSLSGCRYKAAPPAGPERANIWPSLASAPLLVTLSREDNEAVDTNLLGTKAPAMGDVLRLFLPPQERLLCLNDVCRDKSVLSKAMKVFYCMLISY